jgi:hypothetical protein
MTQLKSFEQIVQSAEELDDGSVCINFDVTCEYNITQRTGGYVLSRQDDDDQCFYVNVFDKDGNVLSETVVPFEFNGVPEEES